MKRILHACLAPLRWLAFVIAVIGCAVLDGTDKAEDWYTDGKGLGKILNDGDEP